MKSIIPTVLPDTTSTEFLMALTGRRNSGKTMVAEYLTDRGFERRSFASVMKQMLITMGFPTTSLFGTNEQKDLIVPAFGVSGRYAMQTLGSEWGRDLIGPNVWVDAFFAQPLPRFTVIDDLRFPNEEATITSHGGVILRINRPSAMRITDTHESEVLIDSLQVDHEVENNATPDDLFRQIDALLADWGFSLTSPTLAAA